MMTDLETTGETDVTAAEIATGTPSAVDVTEEKVAPLEADAKPRT